MLDICKFNESDFFDFAVTGIQTGSCLQGKSQL